jgi:anaerobic magnesium-protoporphyrin IX monomethyl ester cyclase
MKILLINPITSFQNLKKDRKGVAYPLGIGYIGAYLVKSGHEVRILDNNQKCFSKEEIVEYLLDFQPDAVGIGAMVNSYNQVQQLTKLIKEVLNVPIVLGGAMATYCSKTTLKNMDIDVCVLGEGEEIAGELFDNWPNYQNIEGISYLNDAGEFIENDPKVFTQTRSEYPYPGYDGLLDIENYLRANLSSWETPFMHDKYMKEYRKKVSPGTRIASMVTGMGCPYKCTFCTNSTHFMKTRVRSPDDVAKEVLYLKEKYNIEGVHFVDDLLILQKKRTLELCESLGKTGVKWAGQSVGRATSDEEVVKILSESGCVGFGLGVESGSDKMLQAMMKGSRTKNYESALENALKYGLGIRTQMLYGSPGESRETLEETVEWFRSSNFPPRRYNRLVPMPGSAVYDQCVSQGIITNEHDFLNFVSMLWGYASKEFIFNITTMSDEEYIDNCDWAESEMYSNYEKAIKSDPTYYTGMVLYYMKKMISPEVIIRKINGALLKIFKSNDLNDQSFSSIDTIREKISYYPELIPNKDKKGYINKPLIDARLEKIFSTQTNHDKSSTVVIDKISGIDLSLLDNEKNKIEKESV